MHSYMHWFAPPGQRFLLTALFAASLLGGAAHAYLPPDLAQRRTQIVQMLPYTDVAALHTWVDQLPVELSPQEYLQRLNARFPATPRSVAWVFYAGWTYLDRLDLTQQAYVLRLRDLDTARAHLLAYEKRTTSTLRTEVEPGTPAELQLAAPDSAPKNDTSDAGLHVFRLLPWPERFTREDRLRLLQAGRADMEIAKTQSAKIEGARKQFALNQDRWALWLSQIAGASTKWTAGQYLAPYGPGMPEPPN